MVCVYIRKIFATHIITTCKINNKNYNIQYISIQMQVTWIKIVTKLFLSKLQWYDFWRKELKVNDTYGQFQ